MVEETLRWYLPYEAPMALQGFAWFARDRVYNRLPRQFPKPFRPEVEALATNTAGGQVRFRTDSRRVAVRVKLAGEHGMDHMPATGQCGFDCYAGEPFAQHYCATARFNRGTTEYESLLLQAPDRQPRYVTLNFPLYQGVQEVLVGLETDAQLLPPPPYADDRPVIVYGTSITQGGCASRPGMAYTNILSRRMNRPFINLGFSGNGRGDPEVAEAIAEIPHPAGFVLDYEGNARMEALRNTLPNFIATLRAAHPKTPILVLTCIRFARELIDPSHEQTRLQARDFQQGVVAQLNALQEMDDLKEIIDLISS